MSVSSVGSRGAALLINSAAIAGLETRRRGRAWLWRDCDLQDILALMAKQIIGRRDIVQLEAMCDEALGVDTARGHQAHQAAHALLAAGAQCRNDANVAQTRVERIKRQPQIAGVYAET